MKTINLTRHENKSWNEITNAAGEVKELWESVSKEHNREELIGQRITCKNMIDGLLVDLRNNTKEEAAENVRKAYNLISKFIEAVAKTKQDFLESEEGQKLTAEFESNKKALYGRIVNINNDVRKRMEKCFAECNTQDYAVDIKDCIFLNDYASTIIVRLIANGCVEDILEIKFMHNDFYGRTIDKLTFDAYSTRAFELDSCAAYRYIVIGQIIANGEALEQHFTKLFLDGIQEVIEIQEQARKLEHDYNQATTF